MGRKGGSCLGPLAGFDAREARNESWAMSKGTQPARGRPVVGRKNGTPLGTGGLRSFNRLANYCPPSLRFVVSSQVRSCSFRGYTSQTSRRGVGVALIMAGIRSAGMDSRMPGTDLRSLTTALRAVRAGALLGWPSSSVRCYSALQGFCAGWTEGSPIHNGRINRPAVAPRIQTSAPAPSAATMFQGLRRRARNAGSLSR
jgi:hypothetical protein